MKQLSRTTSPTCTSSSNYNLRIHHHDSFFHTGRRLADESSHLEHLQQCLFADLKPFKWLFFLHHSLTQSFQVPKLSAGHSPGGEHGEFIPRVYGHCCSGKYQYIFYNNLTILDTMSLCFNFACLKKKTVNTAFGQTMQNYQLFEKEGK